MKNSQERITAVALGGSQQFAFAGVNLAIAQYELKEDEDAVKTLRKLLARYAEAFPDARAAYALILWDQGDRIEAATRKPTELNPCFWWDGRWSHLS